MSKQDDSVSGVLRAHLAKAGSLRSLEQATGVLRQSLASFLRGETDMRVSNVDALARHLGLVLRPAPPERRTKGRAARTTRKTDA
jgi:hypothetical protein